MTATDEWIKNDEIRVTSTNIESIETWACSLPLTTPLNFGSFRVVSREYVAVRMTTTGGLVADCLVLSRRSPIDVVASDVLARLLIGKNAIDIAARSADMANGTRATDRFGVIGRACSMLEICMWDIAAQADNLPLWQKLGGEPRALDVLLVEGYALPGENDDSFAERLASRVSEGFRRLKIEGASYGDPKPLSRRLAQFRKIAGDGIGIVVDLAWSWPNARTGIAAATQWKQFGLSWIEDPLPRNMVEEIVELRRFGGLPIGVGDETTDPAELMTLMDAGALDVCRIDALAIGGIGSALATAKQAIDRGLEVSMHEHPELHEHLAFALPSCTHVEVFPQDRPFVRSHDLLKHTTMDRVSDGLLRPPTEPGTGISLCDEAVRRYCYRHRIVNSADAPLGAD